ncbi:MAG: ABC transporter substrate-binding protein [Eubacteriales bacterium]
MKMSKLLKKISAIVLTAAMVASLAACATTTTTSTTTTKAADTTGAATTTTAAADTTAATEAKTGKVYFLNFKPEQDAAYQAIAKQYTEATGVAVTVLTAASGTYEQTLTAEIAKTDAPTIFQMNGPVGYASWKDYCADLSKSEIYTHLTDKSLAITDGTGVFGIPFAIEGYGIIYNNAIMTKYFATAAPKAASMDAINNFATLKAVVEDMTAKAADLGIQGVFASTSLKSGEDWRWQTHLLNVPLYYEFKDNKIDLGSADATKTIKFQYSTNFQNIFDLYLNNSVTAPKMLGNISVDDSMAEFALGQCAMVQNGNWAYGQISGVAGNTVQPADVKFMPIYTGMAGEEKQGLCIGTENYFAINKNAPAEDQKASLDFLTWLYTSADGKKAVVSQLGFIAPFDTFSDTEKPTDPLAQNMLAWASKPGITSVAWNFTIFPSQTFKDNVGAALLGYAQGQMKWDAVSKLVVDQWAAEKANVAG